MSFISHSPPSTTLSARAIIGYQQSFMNQHIAIRGALGELDIRLENLRQRIENLDRRIEDFKNELAQI